MQFFLLVILFDDEIFVSFVVGVNEQVVLLLVCVVEYFLDWCEELVFVIFNVVFIFLVNLMGGNGKGKSYLLYVVCYQFVGWEIFYVYLNCVDLIGLFF